MCRNSFRQTGTRPRKRRLHRACLHNLIRQCYKYILERRLNRLHSAPAAVPRAVLPADPSPPAHGSTARRSSPRARPPSRARRSSIAAAFAVSICTRVVPAGFASGSRCNSATVPNRDQLRQIDVAHPPAPLRLIHVVRGHEKRHALPRQLKQQIPQRPPRYRIDARRRLVQKHHLRRMNDRAGQRQPLLPSAGELPRPPLHIRLDPRQLLHLAASAPARASRPARTRPRRTQCSPPPSGPHTARTSATCNRHGDEFPPHPCEYPCPESAPSPRSASAARTAP